MVLFDSNVLLDAIRDPASSAGQLLTRVPLPQRATSGIVLYEVAFARRGLQNQNLVENQEWLADHGVRILPFADGEARRFQRLMAESANLVRGKATLGDALIASHLLRIGGAFATRNTRDFEHLDVLLIEEFGA